MPKEREYQQEACTRKKQLTNCYEALRILKDDDFGNGYHDGTVFKNFRETIILYKTQLQGRHRLGRMGFNSRRMPKA